MRHEIRIPNPCSQNWDAMAGNERSRFCARCNRTVVNLSVLTRVELEVLIDASKGIRLCGRYVQRPDGSMITRDGSSNASAGLVRAPLLASAALMAMLSVGPAPASAQLPAQDSAITQTESAQAGFALVVMDSAGAAIPDAVVHLVNQATMAEWNGKTDQNGQLESASPSSGKYTLEILAPGFKPFQSIDLALPFRGQVQLAFANSNAVVRLGPPSLPIAGDSSSQLRDLPMPQDSRCAIQNSPASTPDRPILRACDAAGAIIQNATVTLSREHKGQTYTGQTGRDGLLHFPNLPKGEYTVEISAPGFLPFQVEHVALPSQDVPNFTLQTGVFVGEIVAVDRRNPVQKFLSRLKHLL